MNKDGYNINEFYCCIVKGCKAKSLSYVWLLSHRYRDHPDTLTDNYYTKERTDNNAVQSRDIIRQY